MKIPFVKKTDRKGINIEYDNSSKKLIITTFYRSFIIPKNKNEIIEKYIKNILLYSNEIKESISWSSKEYEYLLIGATFDYNEFEYKISGINEGYIIVRNTQNNEITIFYNLEVVNKKHEMKLE